ncbi:hypothetical protein [Paenibacillus spongiae]|uniref:Helicase XPB/Ssl2 N-terminal domain-containing protein n=1 Tax=Paenibacillus spongiae TaxID=2909671 RepID=A0ABY5SIA7_9BACL|nr:hypothetical protein [Paenibacillus spongiae]UVI32410.1 hypothetical protein L1F29_11565 [Paenibacillus spongiae]
MNLADMLSYADIGQLSRIATTYSCECNGHSKNELIQSILQAVGRKEVFEAQVGSMKLEELRFMNSLLFDPRDSFSLEELIARVQQSKFGEPQTDAEPVKAQGAHAKEPKAKRPGSKRTKAAGSEAAPETGPRATITRFKQYGWLFNGFSGPNRYLFQVPADLKIRFRETLERRFMGQLTYAADDPQAYRDEQQLLGCDVSEMLTFIYQNDIPLTAEGAMYKRSVLQIIDRLGVKEMLPARGEWRFGYGRRMKEYPNRMAFIYDYCYFNGWITETGPSLALTSEGMQRQAQRRPEQPDKLYRFWLRLYKNAVPNLRSLVHWIDKLSPRWVSAESLKNTLSPFIKPYYYDNAETIFEQRLSGMMLHLGLIRIGEHNELGRVIRMTPLGRAVIAGLNLEDEEAIVLE